MVRLGGLWLSRSALGRLADRSAVVDAGGAARLTGSRGGFSEQSGKCRACPKPEQDIELRMPKRHGLGKAVQWAPGGLIEVPRLRSAKGPMDLRGEEREDQRKLVSTSVWQPGSRAALVRMASRPNLEETLAPRRCPKERDPNFVANCLGAWKRSSRGGDGSVAQPVGAAAQWLCPGLRAQARLELLANSLHMPETTPSPSQCPTPQSIVKGPAAAKKYQRREERMSREEEAWSAAAKIWTAAGA